MTKRHFVFSLLLAGIAGAILSPAAGTAQGPTAQPRPPQSSPFPPIAPPPAPSAAQLATPPANATKLPSGVVTVMLRPGTGTDTPLVHDLVTFRAIGRRLDGSVIQDGFAMKDPTRMTLSRLNVGWQEGLASMKVGEQKRFWFPAELMPLDKVSGKKEPVVFDIELLQLVRMQAPPRYLRQPDPKARKAGEGTSVLTTKAGDGGKAVVRTDAAMLAFTLWNSEGQLVNSSSVEGRPTLFPLEKVMPSFADCLLGMTTGEVRLCWIPALHNDGFPGALKGDLIFQVQLLGAVDSAKLMSEGLKPANP
jgi:FKBP-type peptidyl-prolyl cis-trans isomerase